MPDIFTKAYEYKNTLYAMLNMFEYIVPTAPTATVAAAYAISYDRESLFTSNCSLLSTVVAVAAMPILIVILEVIRNIGLFA